MDETEFRRRTKVLALQIISLVEALPRTRTSEVIGKQLLRSGTSIGPNYRAACQARSTREVYAKLSIVEEEADESMYWCELLDESGQVPRERTAPIIAETREILAMTIASKKTLAKRLSAVRQPPRRELEIGN
jgi:four helix bundle protein